jgi:hypothetical protein
MEKRFAFIAVIFGMVMFSASQCTLFLRGETGYLFLHNADISHVIRFGPFGKAVMSAFPFPKPDGTLLGG